MCFMMSVIKIKKTITCLLYIFARVGICLKLHGEDY